MLVGGGDSRISDHLELSDGFSGLARRRIPMRYARVRERVDFRTRCTERVRCRKRESSTRCEEHGAVVGAARGCESGRSGLGDR